MNRRTFLVLVAAAATTLLPMPSFAAKKNSKKNKKSKKEEAEAKARAKENAARAKARTAEFLELDKDGNGFLIGDEIPKGDEKLDGNGDKRLSRSEFSRGRAKGKPKADTKK